MSQIYNNSQRKFPINLYKSPDKSTFFFSCNRKSACLISVVQTPKVLDIPFINNFLFYSKGSIATATAPTQYCRLMNIASLFSDLCENVKAEKAPRRTFPVAVWLPQCCRIRVRLDDACPGQTTISCFVVNRQILLRCGVAASDWFLSVDIFLDANSKTESDASTCTEGCTFKMMHFGWGLHHGSDAVDSVLPHVIITCTFVLCCHVSDTQQQ